MTMPTVIPTSRPLIVAMLTSIEPTIISAVAMSDMTKRETVTMFVANTIRSRQMNTTTNNTPLTAWGEVCPNRPPMMSPSIPLLEGSLNVSFCSNIANPMIVKKIPINIFFTFFIIPTPFKVDVCLNSRLFS